MHRLIYISRSLIGDDRSELEAIVAISAVRNAAAGITGVPWFDTSSFAQVLEGERAAIAETTRRIETDARHADVEIICDREIRQPIFGDWSMTLPHETLEGVEATAYLIGFARNERSAPAKRLYEIAMASDNYRLLSLFDCAASLPAMPNPRRRQHGDNPLISVTKSNFMS